MLIDPTNAVEHGIGVLRTPPGESGARRIAALAPGAQVVKAFHLFPAEQWSDPTDAVADGRDLRRRPRALDVAATLIRDAGAEPAVLGGLDRARQLEEVAGFTIGLAFTGTAPRAALPHLPSETLQTAPRIHPNQFPRDHSTNLTHP